LALKKIPLQEPYRYEFNRDYPPTIKVRKGETFSVETEDALSGRIKTETELPIASHMKELYGVQPRKSNPVAGPIYIEGADKGDVLVVSIHDIIPAAQGVTVISPRFGPLNDSQEWAECRGPLSKVIKHLPGPSGTTSDGKGVFDDKTVWDLQPMIGTIATAPERVVFDTGEGQGPWGGNIDCRDVRKGSKVYLPVYNTGGLLFVGDVHATQADTEFTGWADECRAELVLTCDVIKHGTIPFVRIEKADSLVQVNCYRPLEQAILQAMIWMMDWLVKDYGMDKKDAYVQMSVNPDVRVNVYQMVQGGKIEYTVGVEYPKKCLRESMR
jgi:amidase